MIIAVNGRLCDEAEAVVSVYDHGFLYGIGLFETFRTYGGRPFLLAAHLERMEGGCRELGIQGVPSQNEIERLLQELLVANSLPDAYVRLSVSAGSGALGLPTADYAQPNVIIYVKPLPPRDEELYVRGKTLQLLRLRRNSPEGRVRHKSFHYMNSILAKRELQGYEWAQGAEGLQLTEGGHVAEGIVSNVFWIREGTLYTPSIETGILPGITRGYVLELAQRIGCRTSEGCYDLDELLAAEESFLTNSIQEIVPVTRICDYSGQERVIGEGKAGQATERLIAAYSAASRLLPAEKEKLL